MGSLVELVFWLLVFGLPLYAVKRKYDLKQASVQRQLGDGAEKELQSLREEKKQLQARVENLESIVCSVDYELNAKLAQVLNQPAPAPALADTRPLKTAPVRASGTESIIALASPRQRTREVAAPASVPAGELSPGAVVAGRYHVKRLLGRGGMGAVYLADDESLNEVCALKVISSAWSHDPVAASDRFRREAQAARRISSPNVIRLHDLGEAPGGLLYISMEYFAGKSLSELLAARGLLPISEGGDILRQVSAGLGAAHQVGVVHRDLKPQNILIGERRAVKIIDFGLAKASFLEGMTATGLILGTPEYMAPEQVRGHAIDARTDIYALGALAYHVLCGRPPFVGETPIAVGFAHVNEVPRPPRALRPEIPEPVEAVIMAALAKDPENRPASADQIAAAL